jgi:glycosyltransferase involved in cell wall biosynthesis
MMRITFVVPALETSGGARIVAGHARLLAEKGHDVVIVGPSPRKRTVKNRVKAFLRREPAHSTQEQSHYSRAGVPIEIIGPADRLQAESFPDADVVIATFWKTVEWIWPLPPSKGAKVHFIQGYEVFTGVPTEPVDAVWRLPTHKIAVSQWLVELGRERFGADDIALVPNSVDHHLFDFKPRGKSDIPTVGYLFSGADFKDAPSSLAAVTALKRSMPDLKVLSFGAVRPRADQLLPGTDFRYLPSQDEIADIYSRCDAWLSTSRQEGFNLPPIEAMACGCPAVCTKTGRPLEIIEDGVNGFLVDQGDVEGFRNGLARILSLPDDAWRKMSEAAARSIAHPTWAETSALFEDALRRSINASRT